MSIRVLSKVKSVLKKRKRFPYRRIMAEEFKGFYDTRGDENEKAFGRLFLNSFGTIELRGKKRKKFAVLIGPSAYESHHSLLLQTTEAKGGCNQAATIAEAKLGFEKRVVVIEALQGRKNAQPLLERFREMHGMPWANYLIGQVENHAKRTGFKWVAIRAPASLKYYKAPMTTFYDGENEIRRRIDSLYSNAAKAMGYKKKGMLFIKRLQ